MPWHVIQYRFCVFDYKLLYFILYIIKQLLQLRSPQRAIDEGVSAQRTKWSVANLLVVILAYYE